MSELIRQHWFGRPCTTLLWDSTPIRRPEQGVPASAVVSVGELCAHSLHSLPLGTVAAIVKLALPPTAAAWFVGWVVIVGVAETSAAATAKTTEARRERRL